MITVPIPPELNNLVKTAVKYAWWNVAMGDTDTLLVRPSTGQSFAYRYSDYWKKVIKPKLGGVCFPVRMLRHIWVEGERVLGAGCR